MTVGLVRASLLGFKREVSYGAYLEPTVGTEVVALRPGSELAYEPEALDNDELLNDIGAAKSSVGKENTKGKHPSYLRHSGVEGQEPQLGLLYESIFGSKYIVATERVTIAGSTVSVIKVGVGLGINFRVGQALLIKDGVNSYSIRNVKEISGDDLTLNFNLNNAPAAGVGLGKAIVYIPAAQGHPSFATTKWVGNGYAKECSAGNTTTSVAIKAAANGYAESEFGFEGTKYFFNPIVIDATNKFLDVVVDAVTHAISVPEGVYKTPIELSDALSAALLSVITAETFTFVYSNITGKFTIACSTATTLALPFATGANAANTIALKIGFTATDKSGALTYTSYNEQSYACSLTPTFDSGELIVMKGAQLCVGLPTDNISLITQEASINISKEVSDVDDFCEATGISEKIPVGRVAEMTITMALKKHDAGLLDALLKNSTISAMLNAGSKTGGNWRAGQCFNMFLQSATVSKYSTTGDSFIQVELGLKGFVTTTTKDIFVNFV